MKWLGLLAILLAAGAPAQDAFEIQVYDSQTAPALSPGIEIHLNNFLIGSTQAAGPVLADNLVTHVTFEPHLGLSDWAELGGYFQTALQPDGSYQYAGVKLRFKARWPQRINGWLGLAINVEVSAIPAAFEAPVYGGEVRPILDAQWGHWYAALNPILSFDWTGPHTGIPQPEPAAKLNYQLVGTLAAGLEYYSALGPLLLSGGAPIQRVFGTLDWSNRFVDLNVGVGVGFGSPERLFVKTIVGLHPEMK